ncbi:ornithine decarboxylase 2 [Solenopsis invicta]|uniref:ornithine decarboxylase 2 n=1 Tax=Solenopsis invicta TaxID=13686 RepID=UPI000E33FEA9|nr:ornithine decarboxylase 2 [Solenopsis invicta]
MAQFNFDEIKIFDDTMDDMNILRTLTKSQSQENAFYIADIGNVIKKHQEWITKLPRVIPHFAIKANPDPTVIKVLAALNSCFDCASKQEIKQVMQHGVHGDRIIFAHPTKYPSHIEYAKEVNVKQMTVDSESELFKIKDIFPEAKIIIRIRCDAKYIGAKSLGLKFGTQSNEETVRLIQLTKDLGLNLYGFSFHVGCLCKEYEAYSRGIAMCKELIIASKAIGFDKVQLIDIGGGFEGKSGMNIDEVANVINDAIQDLDSSIRVISEPGTYYVSSSFTLATYLHSKRIIPNKGEMMRMYYMNCGVFHSFIDELLGIQARLPQSLSEPISKEKFLSSIWGPTADSYDLIVKDAMLPEFYIGDWLIWTNMGAYSIAIACPFNGFPIPVVIPFIRKSQLEYFKNQIDLV